MTFELLSGIAPAEVEQVLELGSRLVVPSGTALFRLGEPADCLFLTMRGCIRLSLPMQVRGHDENVLTEEVSAGQTVGWSALIPPYLFTLTATAPVEAEVIAIPRRALQEYFAANPAAGYQITQNLAAVIGHRLHLFQTMWLREMQHAVEVRSA
ncbi:MAG: cyclic nucleotide-binding domain-containing protein [Terracidiphilus sp.]